jgi:hypothetical protein
MSSPEENEQERTRFIYQRYTSPDTTLKSGFFVRLCAFIALLVMGLVGVFALVRDVSGYARSIESARGLGLEIASLELIEDDNPRVNIRFNVRNDSPLAMRVARYDFSLFLNGGRIGSSFSTYLGTDPEVDAEAHRKARYIDEVIAPGESIHLAFTIYIYSAQMEIVRRAQDSDTMSWYAAAEFKVQLPYARDETLLRSEATFEEQ